MERFFIFDKFNTFYDWHLVLTGKSVTPPEPKTNLVDIEGMHGSLDLSESLTGEVTYENRTVTASFWTNEGTHRDRVLLFRQIVSTLHGKKVMIIEPDDPTHYFYGRVVIKEFENTIPFLEFTIEATCEPWRYAIEESERTADVEDSSVVMIVNNYGVKTLCPAITVNGVVKLVYDGIDYELNAGTYKISDIKFRQGINIVNVSGTGSVTFTYREADL